MSETTEELATAVSGLGEELSEMGVLAGQMVEQAGELSEEAGGHGWHGIATRMQEAGEALEAAVVTLGQSQQACENAATELRMINDEIPAAEVAGHLGTCSTELGVAVTEAQNAGEKIEEAQTAVSDIGQEGLMQATSDLHGQLTELQERLAEQQTTSDSEQVQAEEYAKRQTGN